MPGVKDCLYPGWLRKRKMMLLSKSWILGQRGKISGSLLLLSMMTWMSCREEERGKIQAESERKMPDYDNDKSSLLLLILRFFQG